MVTLYDDPISGNGYKVRLLLAQLKVAYHLVELDILNHETRTPEFLAKNPNGRIPLLELDDGRHLAESNAILFYLAQGSDYWPQDRYEQADVLRWMCFEQYSHEPYIAVARFLLHQPDPPSPDLVAKKQEKGYAALDVMEGHLGAHDYFAAGQYTVADIALYAYTHVAEEGGFELDRYPRLQAWLRRIADQPGHQLMNTPPRQSDQMPEQR
jgi:glutathione S-transferase